MEWYLPTFYGDISLVEREPGTTVLKVIRMTPGERKALESFRKRALAMPFGCTAWATPEAFLPLDSPSYVEASGGVEIVLDVELAKARDFLARALKPKGKLVNAVLFKDGALVETAFTDSEGAAEPSEPRVLASAEAEPSPPAPPLPPPRRTPVMGTTVAAPTLGCPAPNFSAAEVRATHVLRQFLNAQQLDDFRRFNRFISVGATTGHQYMLTSRFRRDQLDRFGGRSLYDLDEGRAYCVHDWTVPAAEELLGLHIFLRLPGKEDYLREISED